MRGRVKRAPWFIEKPHRKDGNWERKGSGGEEHSKETRKGAETEAHFKKNGSE